MHFQQDLQLPLWGQHAVIQPQEFSSEEFFDAALFGTLAELFGFVQ
jgi:hypothetical protein